MLSSPSRAAAAMTVILSLAACSGGAGALPTASGGGNLPSVPQTPVTQSQSALDSASPISNSFPTCTWSILPSLAATQAFQHLYGVEAASTSDAWAVGEGPGHRTLALHWNGAAWIHTSTPSPITKYDAYLSSVAEIAANDVWAVGTYDDNNDVAHTLAEHWDGAHWALVPTPPTPKGDLALDFQAIKMISHTNGWAVGNEYATASSKTLIAHWNGTSWTRVASPNVATSGNVLSSLAVISASDIWASGSFYGTNGIVLHYNGVSWTLSHTTADHVQALAAVSGSEVFDVGFKSGTITQSFSEKYNGSSWTQQATPNAGSDAIEVNGAAAVSASEVFGVGFHGGGKIPLKTFAMMWNGTSWVPSQPLAVATSSVFSAAAAIPGTKDALAVGASYDNNSGDYRTLIERAHCL